jgi:hypothetical protein
VQKIAETALNNAKVAAERQMDEMYEEHKGGGGKHKQQYIDLSEEDDEHDAF